MKVVIAPDSFKGSIGAADAAAAIAKGWRRERPRDHLVLKPMADGGEGTLDALEGAIAGAKRVGVSVQGPDSKSLPSYWLSLPDGTAVIELANTSGITLLESLSPLDAHTVGFGEAIASALDADATRLLLAIGSSASTDGGSGLLAALGARFTDFSGRPIPAGNRGLGAITRADLSTLRRLPSGGAIVLGDVSNPLLGSVGAANVFGPQKGATSQLVEVLERHLERWVRVLAQGGAGVDPETPGAGAAGGAGYGLLVWGAHIVPGSVALSDAIDLPGAVASADLVVTGEGRFDSQSLGGKVPSHVLDLVKKAGTRAALIAGSIEGRTDAFASAISLTRLAKSAENAMSDAQYWLGEAGAELAIGANTDLR